jgi:cephalosporin-C deacetylase-like acetyl esterase
MLPRLALALAALVSIVFTASRAEDEKPALAAALRKLNGTAIPAEVAKERPPEKMLWSDVRRRLQAANDRESAAWRAVRTREDWEKFRAPRLAALRQSLGQFPEGPTDLKVRTTATHDGEGFRVENIVFESRPGLLATANLYRPASAAAKMPGILIIPSHHNPKTQGELQDMGMTWARLGCLVLVMDALCHGERRQHPFVDAKSYAKPYRVGRQDYYFRYNTAQQLHLIGDSLVGWMVWDYRRGLDLLLSRPGIDREKIIVLGSVAGGGDPAAVTAALDPRVTAAAIFNFGGPQPETTYPLPADADARFNYAGSGSWESTRNLRLSARDGFLPWVIVAVAPRRLVYAHEFSWDREHDPVWTRLQTIYGFYDVKDRLGETHGRGKVSGKPPEATHCNNIGAVHRQAIYPLLKRWFDMPAPDPEYTKPRPSAQLQCLTDEVRRELHPRPVHELARELGLARAAKFRKALAEQPAARQRQQLRDAWTRLLGEVEPPAALKATSHGAEKVREVTVERLSLDVGGVTIPLLLLQPPARKDERLPVVVGFAQHGKQAFLKHRGDDIEKLLASGATVCLADVRGTGETSVGGRGRQSSATGLSATELMLGQTLLGLQLRDLRAVLAHLRSRPDIDAARCALWGESFAPTNPRERDVAVPLDADDLPSSSEPLGGNLALLGALYDDKVCAIDAGGGFVSFESLLRSPFCYFPHDGVVPGAMTAGDLGDLAAALAPRPLRLEGLVDGLNRAATAEEVQNQYQRCLDAYRTSDAAPRVLVQAERGKDVAAWFLHQLKVKE